MTCVASLRLLLTLVPLLLTPGQTHAGPLREVTLNQVAITIDDLPFTSHWLRSEAALESLVFRLLAQINLAQVPVTGFVNEGQLFVDDKSHAVRDTWLQAWARTTRNLGNHTYAHSNLHEVGIQAFEADVLRGESRLKSLADDGEIATQKYFRHPYLAEGRTLAEKREVDRFLHSNGYRIAPVSIDSGDWEFAAPYDRAELAGDVAALARISHRYLRRLDRIAALSEGLSRTALQRPARHILLLHANALNAHNLGGVLAVFKRRGYRFITLDEALQDPAYALDDSHYAVRGYWQIYEGWAAARGRSIRLPAWPAARP